MPVTSAADELRRALGVHFVHFAGDCLVEIASRRWRSLTFAGERHGVVLRLEGPGACAAADAFIHGLSDREFDLRGHVVADVALVSDRRDGDGRVRLRLEALTVEEN